MLLYLIALFTFTGGIIDSTNSSFLIGFGFCFMGSASIRLIPANFLTRKLTSPIAQTLVRKRNIATQIIGFLLLITGLALSMLLNI
ncbi:hypothetical protein DK924_05225 [Pseudoalteromonas sp. meg-B1]|nr:hypothetical protein DK924_05225 [Pseudoalteromonas sp. meg-B1]